MKYDFLCELCEQEHHILSVRFLFFFIAVSEINLWKLLKIVYNPIFDSCMKRKSL